MHTFLPLFLLIFFSERFIKVEGYDCYNEAILALLLKWCRKKKNQKILLHFLTIYVKETPNPENIISFLRSVSDILMLISGSISLISNVNILNERWKNDMFQFFGFIFKVSHRYRCPYTTSLIAIGFWWYIRQKIVFSNFYTRFYF